MHPTPSPSVPDPSAILSTDAGADVATAVTAHLREFFAARHRTAADTQFAAEVIAPLERFTLDGGKRVRPVFAWWGWRAAGGPASGAAAATALRAVSALELVHSCALLHDDVMDGSALRRGNPTLHVAYARQHRAAGWSGDPDHYGTSLAVLAGDIALVWADDMLTEALADPATRARVHEPWQALRTEMMAGQFLDLRAQAHSDASEATALQVDRFKTAAYSVERPLHFGATLAGGDPEVVRALRGYGADIGTVYQLRDDLLGVYGDPDQTGKPVGDDLREGKRTLLLAAGLRLAREQGDESALADLAAAVGDSGLTDADVRRVAALLDRLGARASVEERLNSLLDSGLRRIAHAPLGETSRRALRELAYAVATRGR